MTQKKILILFYDSDIWIPISVNVSRSERLFRLLEVDMLRIALALIICLISFGCATVNVKTLDKKDSRLAVQSDRANAHLPECSVTDTLVAMSART